MNPAPPPSQRPTLIGDLLTSGCARFGSRPALWSKGRWHTYQEIGQRAAAAAAMLRRLGITPGDRVAVFMENSAEYVAVHFAIHLAGAVEVSLNVELKPAGLNELLNDCDAKALVVGARLYARVLAATALPECVEHVILDETPAGSTPKSGRPFLHSLATLADEAWPPPVAGRVDIDLATIVYTSGTTGQPKGVMLSHLNLLSNTASIAHYLGLTEADRMLVVLPFHYIFGRSLLYTHFLSGGSLVLDNRFAFPSAILDTMAAQEATCFAGVPSTFSILLHKTNLKERTFPHLRLVTQAGGGMAPTLQREVAAAFHPARLFVMYGSTEAAPRLTYVEPEALPRKWGSIGRPIPNVDVSIRDEDGRQLPDGEIGEVAARGSNIMMGYWKDPEGTARVIRNGYYFTNDLGYRDRDGFIFLTGRAKDMIKTGGNRVSAKEIEDALAAVPGVVESAVLAVPDEILGEAIKAFVVADSPALTGRDIQQRLAGALPAYKVPKFIELRAELPKSAAGKIQKALLVASAT